MLKAVIIDENATSRGLLQTILVNNGWEVAGHTNSNAKGLLLLQKLQPHFICIDLGQIDDEGLLDRIRQDWPKTLIFVIASTVDAQTVQNMLARGVHGFFIKPFNQATVANTVRSAVLRLVKQAQQPTN